MGLITKRDKAATKLVALGKGIKITATQQAQLQDLCAMADDEAGYVLGQLIEAAVGQKDFKAWQRTQSAAASPHARGPIVAATRPASEAPAARKVG